MRISDWSSDVCSSDLPWLESSRIGGDPCLRARDHVVLGCGQLVHKPFAQGLRGRKAAAFGEERQRLHETEHAHRANDAPAARQDAQAHLGKSELALGIVERDAAMGCQGKLKSAPKRASVDRKSTRLN